MKKYFLNRLREPSTWAALSGMVTLFGLAPFAPLIIKVGAVVTGAIAIAVPEGK